MVSAIRGLNRAIHPQSYFTAGREVSGATSVAPSALIEAVVRVLFDDRWIIAVALAARDLERERAVGVRIGYLAFDDLATKRSASGFLPARTAIRGCRGGGAASRTCDRPGALTHWGGGRLWRPERKRERNQYADDGDGRNHDVCSSFHDCAALLPRITAAADSRQASNRLFGLPIRG
jgi:hypothetical protein